MSLHSRKTIVCAAFLVAAVVLVYVRGVGGPFLYDDKVFVVENPSIKSVGAALGSFGDPAAADSGHFRREIYRPIIPLVYSLIHAVAGLRPEAYHLLNVCLHAANAVLLFALILLITRKQIPALFAAAWWALHPANVESVQWISGLDDVLVATFILGALLAHGYGKKILSYCLFMLALLTKETALVAPLLFFAMDYWRGDLTVQEVESEQKQLFDKRRFWLCVKTTAPYFILALGFFAIRAALVGVRQIDTTWGDTPIETTLIMMQAFARYMQLVFFPVSLRINYWSGFEQGSWLFGGLGFALMMLLAVCAFMARRRCVALTLGVAWFFIFLIPVSNIVPSASIMAEHFLYLPLAGAALALSVFAGAQSRRATVFQGAWIAIIWLFVMLSIARIGVWTGEQRFWKDIMAKEPDLLSYHVNLATFYARQGRFDEAEPLYQFVLTERPGDAGAAANYAQMLFDAHRYQPSHNLFSQLCWAYPQNERYCQGEKRAAQAIQKTSQ
jgi:protein O-mannosyl-transferase